MKNKLINEICNYKAWIIESPELFHGRMDEELIELFDKIIRYLEREEK